MTSGDSRALAAAVIRTLTEQDYFEDAFELFSLEGADGRKRRSMASKCVFDPTALVFATLPTVTRNIYLTISDGEPALVRQILATVEDTEDAECVHAGTVLPFDDPALGSRGIAAVMLLPGNLFSALSHVPASVEVDGAAYPFLSLIFLTRDELEVWRTAGHDALMDQLQDGGKDLVAFGGGTRS